MNSQDLIWPNFYIVGAERCGTSSLHEHLRKHPQVFLPEKKEPEFFATNAPPGEAMRFWEGQFCSTLEEYQALYRGSKGHIAIGDASTGYLWDENAARRIYEVCPEAKIIIILRDPVARAFSAYMMLRRYGADTARTFSEALIQDSGRHKTTWFTSFLYIECGLYCAQIRRYFERFGRDRVLVLLFEDLVRDPGTVFVRIGTHIGIDPSLFAATDLSEPSNAFKMPRSLLAYRVAGLLGLRSKLLSPTIRKRLSNSFLFKKDKPQVDLKSRLYLQEIYAPDILCLEELLGRKLPELRKSWV